MKAKIVVASSQSRLNLRTLLGGRTMKCWIAGLLTVLVLSVVVGRVSQAGIIDMVTVGNPGNAADSTGYGTVDYVYAIGKYEVTAGQYTAFLNAVAATDTYGLYTISMTGTYGCQIVRSGLSGSYTYSVAADRANRPVNYVSWGDAARFMNWLHNGQPIGAQGKETTERGAYTLDSATSHSALMAITRNAGAKYWIPTEDEWYKAAYHKNDGVTGNYFAYPTGSDRTPSNRLLAPDPGKKANFLDSDYTIGSPYWTTEVGAFTNSSSPYGTFDQGGNVWEWNEAPVTASSRGFRGGDWTNPSYLMQASTRGGGDPTSDLDNTGFRVASSAITAVPEPSSIVVWSSLGAVGLLMWWRRRRVRSGT